MPSAAPPRSLTTMSAPRLARSRACERPRPPPAPVMIATLPSNPRSAMPAPASESLRRGERTRGRGVRIGLAAGCGGRGSEASGEQRRR